MTTSSKPGWAVRLTGGALGTKDGKPHVTVLEGRYPTLAEVREKFSPVPLSAMKREFVEFDAAPTICGREGCGRELRTEEIARGICADRSACDLRAGAPELEPEILPKLRAAGSALAAGRELQAIKG